MRKTEAIRIIYQAAMIYDKQLNDKKNLIIYGAPNTPKFIEALAASSNFLHLTGVKLNDEYQDNAAERFYLKAINRKLKEDDFYFKDHTTEQKLNVLIQTLRISTNAKIIGDFNNSGLKLQTDKLAGSVYSCLGFIKVDNYYIPNTVLEGDIRKNTNDHQRILAIISKRIDEPKYNEIKYVAKNIDIQRLLDKIKDNISIDKKLLKGSGDALSAPNVSMISYTPVSYSGGAAALSPNSLNINLQSFVDKVKDSIGNVTGKKLKQQCEVLKEEIKSLKNQLFQKDKQIAKKDSQIADLIKASNNFIMERNALKEVCEHQKNVINRTNQWINANPDVKERMKKSKEQSSLTVSDPSKDVGLKDPKLSKTSKMSDKQPKPKNKKGVL